MPRYSVPAPMYTAATDLVASCLAEFRPSQLIVIITLIERVHRQAPELAIADGELADIIARMAIARGHAVRFD
jgi:hypothetical protein